MGTVDRGVDQFDCQLLVLDIDEVLYEVCDLYVYNTFLYQFGAAWMGCV